MDIGTILFVMIGIPMILLLFVIVHALERDKKNGIEDSPQHVLLMNVLNSLTKKDEDKK